MAKAPVSNKSLFLIGDTISFALNPPQWSKELMAQGPVVEGNILGKTLYFIWGAEAMKAFCDGKNIARSTIHSQFDAFLFNNHRNVAPVMDGEAHQIRKAILVGAHSSKNIEGFLNKVAPMVEDFILNFAGSLNPNGDFTELLLWPKAHEFEVQFMGKIFFSVDVDDQFQKEMNTFIKGMVSLPIDIPGFEHHKGLQATQYLLDFSRNQLQEHRKNPDKYDDMMAILIKLGPNLTDDDIILELHHFMFAATAIAISLCSSLAAALKNPEIYQKLKAEVDQNKDFLGLGQHYNEQLVHDKLKYTQCVLKEALRYYPIIPIQQGTSLIDFEVEGFKIPANTWVLAGYYATDMDPKVYPDPEAFKPERYETLKDVETSYFWTPFGPGQRLETHRCAGQPTVLAITTYLIAKMVKSFDFELVDPHQALEYSPLKGPMPTRGMPVKMRVRKD